MEAQTKIPKPSEILTIQKFVFLLDDFCRKEFKQHLLNTNSLLSHKLIEAIEKNYPGLIHMTSYVKRYMATARSQVVRNLIS